MALNLYMLGLNVREMRDAVLFYRRLGVELPPECETQSHVEVKMGTMTFFLDSRPWRWDPQWPRGDVIDRDALPERYPMILEFFLETHEAVDAKHAELIAFGYRSFRAPYTTGFNMRFAMVLDPDGNVVLLSGTVPQETAST